MENKINVEVVKELIKNLEKKVLQSRCLISQARKQYNNSVLKLEKQKQNVEKNKGDIDKLKIKIANRTLELQALKMWLDKYENK